MLMRASVSLPGQAPEVVDSNAVIMLGQDAERTYAVMHGPKNVLQTLLVWGAENWFILPPGPEYFRAVAEVLIPKIAKNDDTWLQIAPRLEPSGETGGIGFELTGALRDTKIAGMTDMLLFVLDGSAPKSANGGSGMQKGRLLEVGIAEMFGNETAEAFIAAKYAGLPPGVRNLVEGMRRGMREQPGEALVITPEAMDEMVGKGDKEKN